MRKGFVVGHETESNIMDGQAVYELTMDRSDIDETEFTQTEVGILDMLEEGRCTPAYIAAELDVTQEYVRERLKELRRLGLVKKVHRGLYELADDVDGPK
jgi:DNA-binding MarR family transcriptional regulator